jgi:hypothetical protein
MKTSYFPSLAALMMLAACGGGGGSTGGGGLPPVISSPTTQPSAQPSTAPISGSATTVSGTVVQMTGPLSSQTWNLAAPTGCTGGGCVTYPTPPPTLPSATATPGVGAGLAGVTVYAVPNADVAGIPATPLATATTGPSGAFSITLPKGTSSVGLIALDGPSYNAQTGASSTGFTLGHTQVTAGSTTARLYVDTLSPDEQTAFESLNAARGALPPVSSDTLAQADARLAVAQQPGAATCDSTALLVSFTTYKAWGGVGSTGDQYGDGGGGQWSEIVTFQAPYNGTWNFTGMAAVYQATACGTSPGVFNYYSVLYVD